MKYWCHLCEKIVFKEACYSCGKNWLMKADTAYANYYKAMKEAKNFEFRVHCASIIKKLTCDL